jgi:hypothetical protein
MSRMHLNLVVLIMLMPMRTFAVGAPIVLGGNVLSIYESSDTEGSCKALAARGHLDSFKEIVLSTGRGHGTFFQPDQRWVAPLKAWIAATNR